MTKPKTASGPIDKACITMVRGVNPGLSGHRESGHSGWETLSGYNMSLRDAPLALAAGPRISA
jgi:hypothetical protein